MACQNTFTFDYCRVELKVLRQTAAILLLGAFQPSFALSIGSAQGTAWIGQPLDVVIPLSLDGRDAGGSLCLEADVRQGESRMDDKRVMLSLDPGPTPDTPRVHVRTTHAIVEPVVSIRLSAGCAFKSTRQYTLLADLPVTPAVVAPPSRAARPARDATADASPDAWSGAPVAAPAPTQRSATRRAASGASSARNAEATRRRASAAPPVRRPADPQVAKSPPRPKKAPAARQAPAAAPAPAAGAAPAPAPAPTPGTAVEGQSRLQIEPLTPSTSIAGALATRPGAAAPAAGSTSVPLTSGAGGSSTGGVVGSTPGGATGAGEPTTLAQSGTDADALQREVARMKDMEDALATLRVQSAQTQRLLLELRGELAEAESGRYRNPFVYGLLALVGGLLLILLLMWRSLRRARNAQWWIEGEGDGDSVPRRFRGAIPGRLPRRGDWQDDEDEDGDEHAASAAAILDAEETGAPAQGLRRGVLDTGAVDRAPVRSVNAEELYDVQQQAEFFMSLGKHEQAIGVLRDHVAANPGTSALVYLDLLSVLHALGRRDDYARQAREFEHRFNAEVPPFDTFDRQGRGLGDYKPVLDRIVALWPGPGTSELIEELVFRHPGSQEGVFDLPAYQELLLLHAVVRDLADHPAPHAQPAPAFPEDHAHSPPEPMGAGEGQPWEEGDDQTVPMPYLPEGGRSAAPMTMPAVDLDLADLDRTAFQTLRAPIENLPEPTAPAPVDPHIIDFNPFDPENDDELKPGRFHIKR